MKYILLLIAIFTILIAGCTTQFNNQDNKEISSIDNLNLESLDEIQKFNTTKDLEDFLNKQESAQPIYYNTRMSSSIMAFDSVAESAPMAKAGAGSTDYSSTNVQVAGVDEADFVKNDENYVYLISGNKLIILDEKILSETVITENNWGTKELFLNKDKLVVFTTENEKSYTFNKYDIRPIPTYRQVVKVKIFNIEDRTKPVLSNEYMVSGNYFQSRMIGDDIYLVTQEDSYQPRPLLYNDNIKIIPDVYYFPNPETNYQYNTITSFNIDSEDIVQSKSFLLGYGNTLMMSEDSIYIAYNKNNYWYWNQESDKERFYNVILPLLEGNLKIEINKIIVENYDEDKEWAEIEKVLSIEFKNIEEDNLGNEYEEMFQKIGEALEEYDLKKQLENAQTTIHKFNVNAGSIEYNTKGIVEGQLLNQFSMDEFEGDLRVATTVSIWSRNRIQYNNVYILDEDLKQVSKIEKIAQDEKIYSTRFIEDKLYMVTFKQTDPFFVIDLDRENPKILGELKLPGFSEYLHPFGEDYIIGIGKETVEEKWGVSTKGVKISLFDISNLKNPKLVDTVVIGDSGSYSEVLNDHKAFMLTKDNLLVLPIHEVTGDANNYYSSTNIWDGAYVFTVTNNGFEKLGKIKHTQSDSKYYWENQANVKRSLYIDSNLYTISDKFIKVNDLVNNLEEINSIKIAVDYNYPIYRYQEQTDVVAVESEKITI